MVIKRYLNTRKELIMLYTGSFRDINPDKYDQIWLVVRKLMSPIKNTKGNIYHIDTIAPSQKLLYDTLEMKRKKTWNQETFDKIYAPRYLKEMLEIEPMLQLQKLAELSKTQDVLIACYCKDENLCHRSLIKQIVDTINS